MPPAYNSFSGLISSNLGLFTILNQYFYLLGNTTVKSIQKRGFDDAKVGFEQAVVTQWPVWDTWQPAARGSPNNTNEIQLTDWLAFYPQEENHNQLNIAYNNNKNNKTLKEWFDREQQACQRNGYITCIQWNQYSFEHPTRLTNTYLFRNIFHLILPRLFQKF